MPVQFKEIPREVILSIFNQTSPNDQIKLAQVCKLFKSITDGKSSKLTERKQFKFKESAVSMSAVGGVVGIAAGAWCSTLSGSLLFRPSQLQKDANTQNASYSKAPRKK